jgi:hypothetical protein
MKTLTQKIEDLDTERRKRVEARAPALIAEEMTLQEIRQFVSTWKRFEHEN